MQLRANLRLWMALQSGEVTGSGAGPAVVPAWQSLFLVVPLLSTTFASLARLMRGVRPGSLGWLVVDEAGQALPGAAVGGLTRFRRAVVVGDPLQLEPVVTLPGSLVDELMKHHGAAAELAPTRASVQTLADSVSRLGTLRGDRWISLPLLVHNRCLDPMLTIANEMAYDGAMVQGRTSPAGAVAALGPSRWIHVPRTGGGDHFHDADWRHLQELLARLDWTGSPSLAVISPFKRVARALRERVRQDVAKRLAARGIDDSPAEFDRALRNVGVGTVHTFQGREHDAVVLVLGGATAGARQWAAGTPNLLNVAVTRARDRLYVIGDRRAWGGTGYAAVLDAHLP